jgi:transcription termination/antitermination protein NusA
VIFDLGKTEARMPKREQSRLEQFAVGERVRVVLLRVDRAAKGPQVIVSRAAPALVQSLFQSEVPEIYDGTVQVRAIAREAGERTKIAVVSRDKDVDPVGACVGMKGMRVQSIIRELRGEKIDIIEFSDEVTTFAEKALQPAKVSRVSIIDLTDKQLEVIVDDTQLSLAIGKKGQNVRLAAKLLGWKIDIKSEEEKRQEVEQQMQAMSGGPSTPIEQISDLGESVMEKLIAAGITTVEALADMTEEELGEVPGIGEKSVEKIAAAVRRYFEQLDAAAQAPAPGSDTESPSPEPTLAAGEEAVAAAPASDEAEDEVHSMTKTPEEILAEQARAAGSLEEVDTFSTEDIAAAEDALSRSDANDDADAREEQIELDNDTMDELVDQAGDVSTETVDEDNVDPGSRA